MKTENQQMGSVLSETLKDAKTQTQTSKQVSVLNDLNKILRGEISAVEAYAKVIEKFPADAARFDLAEIYHCHQKNAVELTLLIEEQGEDPSIASGAWGSVVSGLMNMARFIGEKSALNLLIEGEEHGLNEYNNLLNESDSVSVKVQISESFLPQARINIGKLRGITNSLA